MIDSVLLDTSFLISLSDPNRVHHETAKAYYREFIQRGVPMFLSTNRVCVKDDLKLIAQCECQAISHLATEDGSWLVRAIDRLAAAGRVAPKPVLLKTGFDAALFENGQTRLLP